MLPKLSKNRSPIFWINYFNGMVYIPFPRIDLDTHADLSAWRVKIPKQNRDWKRLRDFLHAQARLDVRIHHLSKCWFSELLQGDDNARDVEHFRPKNQAKPLTKKQIAIIQKLAGVSVPQNVTPQHAYSWLEHDYRNYRLVTAITNRGGAKHVYFPLIQHTAQLPVGQFPWLIQEYPLFLDPADAWDARQLMVMPDGEILPVAPRVAVSPADIAGLPGTWHNDSFSYIRAMVTIVLFRLNEKVFVNGRKEKYEEMTAKMQQLQATIEEAGFTSKSVDWVVRDIYERVLPSAMFSLASRCALRTYMPPAGIDPGLAAALAAIPDQVLDAVDAAIAAKTLDWNRP